MLEDGARAPGPGHRRAPGRRPGRPAVDLRRGRLEVRVHPDDLGKVIGRGGRTAKALRTVVGRAAAGGHGRPASTSVDVDRALTARWNAERTIGRRRRIGRAHGVRGEVTVDVRTDEPGARFAPGCGAAHRPGRARAAHRRRHAAAVHSGRLLLRVRRASTTGRAPRRCAARCWSSTSTGAAGRRGPDEFYDHQLVGLAAVDAGRRRARARWPRSCTAPASDLLVVRDADGRERLVPFVRAIVPEPSTWPAAGSSSTRRRGCST